MSTMTQSSRDHREIFRGTKFSTYLVSYADIKRHHINIPILQRFVFSAENEIVEVLEEADFSDYGREKYNLSVSMLKVIYEIKPAKM